MTRKPDDKLENDLRSLEASYRAIPNDEPPDLVDQAILNRARRAASRKTARPWTFGWIHGLTTAAIVILGVALYNHQPQPSAPEPLRVDKPPSSKLQDTDSEVQPFHIPAPTSSRQSTPTVSREIEPEAQDLSGAARKDFRDAAPALENRAGERPGASAPAPLQESADEPAAKSAEENADPAAWVARILALKQAGDEAAMQRELQAFRQAWPDYELPPELSD